MQMGSKQLLLFFLGEINKMRTHPKAFLKHMQDRLTRFDKEDHTVYTRGDIDTVVYRTVQGDKAVKGAYDYLYGIEEGDPLELSYQLCEAAFVIGGRISRQRQPQPQNIGSYEKDLLAEIATQKCKTASLDVIIQYGFRKDRELVPSIIVDDGNESRSRRKALMNEKYKYIGLAVHQHSEYDFQLLILLTDDLEQLGTKKQEEKECQLI